MMKKLITILLLVVTIPAFSFTKWTDDIVIPKDGLDVLHKDRYIVSYNYTYKIPHWVAYEIHSSDFGDAKRSSSWSSDKLLPKAVRSYNKDYYKSGFDKGHLVPAADMSSDSASMKGSFILSNAAPQVPNFNRGIWKSLETQTRKWVKERYWLWVYTGTYFQQGRRKVIGDGVGVPHYWYKIIFDPTEREVVAFVFRNKKYDYKDFYENQTTVDFIEKKTRLNFLQHLPDELENNIESTKVRW